ncbi:ead/Ea22-like family protein [Chromobacterium haemolyticum]|uniref:ead/Ea22-like family protein n=1 Tax=Chromobacterium haemolyticum TaxID=394935 RepID=UPI0017473649|nr:ead/Ea22-like family protein [Chromobacterium haemolyticum]QOD84142.1 ead/Ea22-like family protein [Chromobacterium haemolyticum]
MIANDQLAELARLARAASPGPWEYQTSNGWRRVGTTAANRGRMDGDIVAPGTMMTSENMAFIAAANPATVLALLDRISELERDSARLDYMIENGLFVQAFIMPDLPKMPPTCWLVNFQTGPTGKKQFEDPRAAIDAAMEPRAYGPPSTPQ